MDQKGCFGILCGTLYISLYPLTGRRLEGDRKEIGRRREGGMDERNAIMW
jgi:hypothetical protein